MHLLMFIFLFSMSLEKLWPVLQMNGRISPCWPGLMGSLLPQQGSVRRLKFLYQESMDRQSTSDKFHIRQNSGEQPETLMHTRQLTLTLTGSPSQITLSMRSLDFSVRIPQHRLSTTITWQLYSIICAG